MKFSNRAHTGFSEEPEINLIPFIDVLLVVLIFLMLSTTYSKFTELQIKLPSADTEQAKDYPKEIIVSVASDGRYVVNKQRVEGTGTLALSQLIKIAATASTGTIAKNAVVIISADALASHQSVITVMEAARMVGVAQVTFATQQSK
jgi:biopolymer transport protein ExbD